jgi:hypothetical protein
VSYSGGWRPHLESALCLNLARLFADGTLRADACTDGVLRWTNTSTGAKVASLGYRAELGADSGMLTLNYNANGTPETCRIALVSVRCGFGGRRWLFVCPASGRRALKLYKWAKLPLFRHREAVRPRPTYASQRDGGGDRIMRQRWAIRRKLRDDLSTLFDEPWKPKGMRWRTFERYAERDAELAGREWRHFARLLGRLGAVAPDEAAALAEKYGG